MPAAWYTWVKLALSCAAGGCPHACPSLGFAPAPMPRSSRPAISTLPPGLSPAWGPGGKVESAAVPGAVSVAPRRRKGQFRAEPPSQNGIGEHFEAPRPGRTDGGFGDWSSAPDQTCACVNCMLPSIPGSTWRCCGPDSWAHVDACALEGLPWAPWLCLQRSKCLGPTAAQRVPPTMAVPAAVSNEHANMGQSVYVARRVMPDDNSCLFTAVAYIMEGYRSKGPELRQVHAHDCAQARLGVPATRLPAACCRMQACRRGVCLRPPSPLAWCREVIAQTVLADTATYNEAFLGKSPTEYAKWIKDSSKWGGAIELSILSQCALLWALLLPCNHGAAKALSSRPGRDPACRPCCLGGSQTRAASDARISGR